MRRQKIIYCSIESCFHGRCKPSAAEQRSRPTGQVGTEHLGSECAVSRRNPHLQPRNRAVIKCNTFCDFVSNCFDLWVNFRKRLADCWVGGAALVFLGCFVFLQLFRGDYDVFSDLKDFFSSSETLKNVRMGDDVFKQQRVVLVVILLSRSSSSPCYWLTA